LLLPEENYILGALLVHIRIYSHANGVLGSYTLLLTVTAKVGLGKDGHVVVVIHGSIQLFEKHFKKRNEVA
jgi:hypothetical protein